jgi:cardiolipin synthase (CMP-forming)
MKPIHNRILTVPNQLTFLRLAFLPFFIIAIKYDRYDWALGVLIVSGVSDGLDGLLARGLNQRTPLGAYLDPIADKLLLSSSYFVLALKGKIGWWLAILVLGRDVLILVACVVILLTAGYRPFPPSIWGKATTFFEISLVTLVLLLAVWENEPLRMLRGVCAYCVAAFVMISGIHYSIVVARQLHAEETPATPAGK